MTAAKPTSTLDTTSASLMRISHVVQTLRLARSIKQFLLQNVVAIISERQCKSFRTSPTKSNDVFAVSPPMTPMLLSPRWAELWATLRFCPSWRPFASSVTKRAVTMCVTCTSRWCHSLVQVVSRRQSPHSTALQNFARAVFSPTSSCVVARNRSAVA